MAILPLQRQKEIDNSINMMLMELGMSYPKNSIKEIAEALNLELRQSNELPNDVRGLILKGENCNKTQIIINENQMSKSRNNFTIAHELGHYILHKNILDEEQEQYYIDRYNYSGNSPDAIRETEANYFAASLLAPQYILEKLLKANISIKEIADYFAVSEEMIKNRIQWIKNN